MSCCPVGSEPALASEHKDMGKVITLENDLPAYVVSKPGAKAAVIIGYDIYGFEGQSRIRLVCDQLAEAGFYVVLPDFFRGDKWTPQRMKDEGFAGLGPWLKTFPAEKVDRDFAAAVKHARSVEGVEKVGSAGFCYGGWLNFREAGKQELGLSCTYGAHPSVRAEEIYGGSQLALAEAVLCPMMMDTAGDDPANLKEGGEIYNALLARGVGEMITRDFPGCKHGFCLRGDLNDAVVAAGVKKALTGMHAFFKKHLLGESDLITLGASKVSFTHVAREWRCKYSLDETGGPHNSASLAAAESLLQEHLATLKALPNASVSRVVCGGCGDFKVVVNQPAADHGAWKEKGFEPEQTFLSKLEAIDGTSAVEAQEYTLHTLAAAPALAQAPDAIELGASKVSFTHVAREWRCKYSLDDTGAPHNSVSLAAAEQLLQANLATLKALPNASVARIVCGGCGDFKVVVNQPAADHGAWKAKSFEPEAAFLASLEAIDGITAVEAQEYTLAAL